jgi:hypothetical protein
MHDEAWKLTGTAYMPKSKSDVHETPDNVYELIEGIWGHTKEEMCDPCPVGFTQSALQTVWGKISYVNPPYTLLKEFVADAMHQSKDYGVKTIMLLPAKTDQKWFHDILDCGYKIHWIRGRLKFKNDKWNSMNSHFLVMID